MARRASVRYWESRKAYCAHVNGKQVVLAAGPRDEPNGPTYTAAQAEFKRLTFSGVFGPTVAEVSADYLKWYGGSHARNSVRVIGVRLGCFNDVFGARHLSQVTGPEVETWCAEQRAARGWGDSTVRLTLRTISACARYALRKKMISALPWDELILPAEESRGEEVVLTPSQVSDVICGTSGALREFCVVLRDTGCRPGEAASAEARHFHPGLGAIVLPATSRTGPTHKTGKKTGKPRVIYLRGESLALITRLAREIPHGPLLRQPRLKRAGPFAGTRGPWAEGSITKAFHRLRERCGIPSLIPYSFRHTFAVERIQEGWTFDTLAVVMGTSRTMIERHYGHLSEQRSFLRGLVDGIDKLPAE